MQSNMIKQESIFDDLQADLQKMDDLITINPTKEALEEIKLENQEADPVEAEKLVQKYYIKKLNSEHEMVDFAICDHVNDLQAIGDGVYFYFFFSKYMAIIFGLVVLVAIVPLVLNIIGGGMNFASQIDLLLATTLGNTERIMLNQTELLALNSTISTAESEQATNKLEKLRIYYFIQMASDMLICLIIFIGYYVLRHYINKKIRESQQKNVSVKQYTVWVKGLPERNLTEEKIKEYFEKFHKVIRCNLAYKYYGCLPSMMELAQSKYQLKIIANKKSKRIDKQKANLQANIDKLTKDISSTMRAHNFDIGDKTTFKVIGAFVTFDDPKAPADIANQFQTEYRRNFWEKIRCIKSHVREKYLFEGNKLQFTRPDHPTNIYWENLERTFKSKFFKGLLAFVIFILILALSVSINIFLTAITTSDQAAITCDTTAVTPADILAATDALKLEKIYCYCSGKGITEIFNNDTVYEYCYQYYLEQVKEIGVSLGSGFALTIINLLAEFVAFHLISFIGFVSVSEVVTEKVILSFVLQYLNTGFVILIIYQRIYGWSLVEFLNNLFGSELIKIKRIFPDISRGWYSKVGSKIILPIIIAVFSPHTIRFLWTVFSDWIKRRKACKAKSQKKYIKLRTPETFIVEARYAKLLSALFVILTFATGMPLLFFLYFLMLIVMYWTDKITCLRYSGKPPLYSEDLIRSIAKTIPAALIIHMIFGIYIFSNEEIFPSNITFNNFYKEFDDLIQASQFFKTIFQKCYKCLPYTLEMLLFLIIFLFEDLIDFIIARIQARKKTKVMHHSHDIDTYTANYKRISYFSLPNYNIALNPKYRELLKAMLLQFSTMGELSKNPSIVVQDNQVKRQPSRKEMEQRVKTVHKQISEFYGTEHNPLMDNTIQLEKSEKP